MLDIIVTHYREPWRIVRPFFDMLACQRGVSFDDFKVILVHDGTDCFDRKRTDDYPYRIDQYAIPHGGVSRARNYGLDMADGEWVEFCDCDDCYTHIYALRMVLEHTKRDVDYMWTPFFAEYDAENLTVKTEDKENIIFVHGKYFRRKFLLENRLRFPEDIHYSEDSAFCAIVNETARPGRRGKIKTEFPVYAWTFRKDSVSADPKNRAKNLTGFIDRNEYVVEEFKRRGISYVPMVGRMFADAYWAFHRKMKFPEQEKRFAKLSAKNRKYLGMNNQEDMVKIMLSARKAFNPDDIDNTETFEEWIDRIDAMAQEER